MGERLLDIDPLTGLKTYFNYNEADDAYQFRYEQDVAPVLDANKADQVDAFDKRKNMWHAARIPAGVQYEWLVKYGVNMWDKNHKPAVKRLLNDPEYRWLRVKNFII